MTTKLSGYRSGAVWTVLVVLSHYATLGTAAPAGTVSSKLETCSDHLLCFIILTEAGAHTYKVVVDAYPQFVYILVWWMFTFYIIMCTSQ